MSTSSAASTSATVHSPATDSTEADWTWPAAAALRDNGDDTADQKRWYWRAVVGANSVSKRTFFSKQSSHQLELVLSHWINHSTPMSTLRVERGDQQLTQVWRDLDKGGQEVEGICFDGRHGGLLQITAPTADGWVELCRVRKGAKTEYPRMWNCNDQAPAVYAREDVPKGSPEWRRIQQKLSFSLPGAELTGLERVKNPTTWEHFYRYCVNNHEEGDCHINFMEAGSAVKELWHASRNIDILCKSKIGFDIRRAYRITALQKMKDIFGVGGHVYGYGTYFAAHALYSHWWSTRVWNRPKHKAKKSGSDKSTYQLILAHVFTGNCEDYGGEWAPKLQMAPPGFHSVCGTESNQQVLPVKHFAGKGDLMAKTLLEKGDVYGKQFVVFESYQAYPMYVVTYTCPDDFTPQLTARTQRQMKWEHKAWSEKTWTEYSPKHSMQLSQAFREKEHVIILEQEGKKWRVDL